MTRLRRESPGLILAAPYTLYFLAFVAFPVLYSLYLSVQEGSLVNSEYAFAGLRNYREIFRDDILWKSVLNILRYSAINVPGVLVLSFALAVMVNRSTRGIGFFRVAFFVPVIISPAIVSIIWNWIYSPQLGILNKTLISLSLQPQPWLNSSKQAMPSIAVLNIWRNSGYFMVIWLAGLQNIPASLYESARIDGANLWQRFAHITYPMLLHVRSYIVILLTIMAIRLFTEPYILTEGGPANSTITPIMHLYFTGFRFFNIGYASTIGILVVVITFALSTVERKYFDAKSY